MMQVRELMDNTSNLEWVVNNRNVGFERIPEEMERLLVVFSQSGKLCLGHFVRAYDKYLETKKVQREEDLSKTYTSTFALALRSSSLIEIYRFYKRLRCRAVKMDGGIAFEDFLQAAKIMQHLTEKDCFNAFASMSLRQYHRIPLPLILSKLFGTYTKNEAAVAEIFTRACYQQIDKKAIYRSIPMTVQNIDVDVLADLDNIIKENYTETVSEDEFKEFLLCFRYAVKNANFYLFLNAWKENLLNDKHNMKAENIEPYTWSNNDECVTERNNFVENKTVIPPYYIHEENGGTKILHMKSHPRTASVAEAHRRGNGNIITWSSSNFK